LVVNFDNVELAGVVLRGLCLVCPFAIGRGVLVREKFGGGLGEKVGGLLHGVCSCGLLAGGFVFDFGGAIFASGDKAVKILRTAQYGCHGENLGAVNSKVIG
jgi:hypothetical protein